MIKVNISKTNVTYYVEGKTENGERVKGILTILGCKFCDLEKGFYISNKADSPFAYKVDPDSVIVLGDHIASLLGL